MSQQHTNPFEADLEIVATLRDRAIEARLTEMRSQDDLTIALRQAMENGRSMDSLSEASGLSPSDIRERVKRDLFLTSALEALVQT